MPTRTPLSKASASAGLVAATGRARKAGFEVYLIEDATRAIDPNGSLAAAWKDMGAKGVKRIRSGGLA